ncbi:MAG: glycosyltransferase family 1 protein [bacterium]
MEEQLIGTMLTLPPADIEDGGAPMLVAVEATRLLREVRGIGRYVRALLPRLVALRPGLSLALFVKNQRDVEALEPVFAAIPSLRDRVDIRPVREMTRSGADVFWYPWNTASPTPPRGAVIATIHDIVPIAHPDPRLRGWQKNLRWRRRYAATARRSTLIIADSQFTADEIHRMLGVPRERMRVALLAADDFAIPSADGHAEVLARLGVRAPFVLAVGAADRRKNLALLERAMPRVVAEHPGTRLVLAGPRRDPLPLVPDAVWRQTLGFISDDELAALYRMASVLVMPSTYEGFGLPVLEAMRLGTPVICARGSSLPEVAGDAALWVDGEDDADLAAKIGSVLSDTRVSSAMRLASLEQASRFSWDETARQTIAAFEEAMEMAQVPVRR